MDLTLASQLLPSIFATFYLLVFLILATFSEVPAIFRGPVALWFQICFPGLVSSATYSTDVPILDKDSIFDRILLNLNFINIVLLLPF